MESAGRRGRGRGRGRGPKTPRQPPLHEGGVGRGQPPASQPQAPDRPWDEGMTAEEREDARRRYKNRKGVVRWRRRKQAQREKEQREADALAAGTGAEGAEAQAEGAAPTTAVGNAFAASSTIPPSAEEPEVETLASGVARLQLKGQQGSSTSNSNSNSNSNGSSGIESLTNQAPPASAWSQEGQMLSEFAKLGKKNEAALKNLLDSIASFALIPHGYQRHKDRIVNLAEAVLNITRKGRPTTAEVAQRFLKWGIKSNNAWEDPSIPNIHQIMRVFAGGNDRSTFVNVSLQNGQAKSISLKQLSQLDEAVHTELYITLITQILREMPVALAHGGPSGPAKALIARNMKQASMVASGYVIGQFVSFTTQRAVKKLLAVPLQAMMFAASSLGLRSERRRELWRVYDTAQAELRPLMERNQVLEQQLDSLLAMHDMNSDGSYHAIFQAVEQLMLNFEEQFDVSYFADLQCSHELLTPLQLGLIAAAQVPRVPLNQILAEKIYPYTRISVIFETGAVSRYD